MMGEELNAAEVTDCGLLGDRVYGLVDCADGKVATAKNPRKWPQLFDYRATFVAPPQTGTTVPAVRNTLPDGTIVTSEQSDGNQILSQALKRDVTLETTESEQQERAASISEEYWPDLEGLDYRGAPAHHRTLPPLCDDDPPPGRCPQGCGHLTHGGPAQGGQRWSLCECAAGGHDSPRRSDPAHLGASRRAGYPARASRGLLTHGACHGTGSCQRRVAPRVRHRELSLSKVATAGQIVEEVAHVEIQVWLEGVLVRGNRA